MVRLFGIFSFLFLRTIATFSQTKLLENFESSMYPPAGWSVDFTGTRYWERSAAGAFGQSSGSSVFRFFEAQAGAEQSLTTAAFSATGPGDSLGFDHAYATFQSEVDSLIVHTSVDDGASFTRLVALPGGTNIGTGMVTAGPSFSSFVPTSSQWRSKSYSLPTGTNRVKFTAKSAYGNNLCLDNIKVSALYANDVGVSGILTPRNFVNLPFPQTPRAMIRNSGSANQTAVFATTMDISGPGGYSYSSTRFETLPSGVSREITFDASFSPTQAGTYSVLCYTQLAGDQFPSNDTVQTTVIAGNFNFGTNGGSGSHRYCFSNSLSGTGAPSQPEFKWRDTTGSRSLIENGTLVAAITGDIDDGYFMLTGLFSGRSFRLFGTNYGDTVHISTNGIISFVAGYDDFLPSAIPSGTTPNTAIYPMWMDLDYSDPDVPINRLSYKVDGDILVVTYSRAPRYNADIEATDYVTFQVQMRFTTAPTANSFASVQFDSSQTGSSFMAAYAANAFPHLIGAENGTGTSAIMYRGVAGGAPVAAGPAFGSSLAVTLGPAYASSIRLNLKGYLEGAYSSATHSMRTDIRTTMPLRQPYTDATWSYFGGERVTAIPDSVVDWMLIELRSGPSSATRAARRSAFLKTNGTIVEIDGASSLQFDLLSTGSYYVSLTHRNHLSLMSAGALALGPSTTTYDFTTGQLQAYGTQPMNLLESGVYGMVAGDANRSGIITAADANSVFGTLNVAGYNFNDVNLTGIVTAADANSAYSNLNRATGVPGEANAPRSEDTTSARGKNVRGAK